MNRAVEEDVEPSLSELLLGSKRGKKKKAKAAKTKRQAATKSKEHNTESEPEPEAVRIEPEPVPIEPEPFRVEPEPVPIEPEPFRVEPEPVPIEPEPVPIEPEPVPIDPEPVPIEPKPVQVEEESSRNGPTVSVSMFDDSVENHFRVMHTIAKLCGEADDDHGLEESEVQRLSSSITFLREWADFKYEPRDVRFSCERGSPDEKDVVSGIQLRQFSSATVPKKEALPGDTSSTELSQDFVMYVGGPVWALDWCPRIHESPDYHTKCEFIAIAAHPPGSSYHKLGEPLTGRGAIQIWCLLNVSVNEGDIHPIVGKPKRGRKNTGATEENSTHPKKPLGRPRKKPIEEKSTQLKKPKGRPRKKPIEEKATQPDRPIGRPRKKPIEESVDKDVTEEKSTQPKRPRRRTKKKPTEDDNLDGSSNYVEALAVQYPEESSELLATDCVPANTQEHGKKRKRHKHAASASNPALETSVQRRILNDMASAGNNSNDSCPLLLNQNEEEGLVSDHHIQQNSGQYPQMSNNVSKNGYSGIGSTRCSVPKDVALPRIILCLAHHGKVAWDVKWRPPNEHDSKCKHRMGYLAVLSGSGSLEVWEVPLPRAVEVIYSNSCAEGTDPRFVKLAPVFRCSTVKCGGIESIPLTVEWSTSPPHDYLLAGCHDGTVALWKFSASNSSKDTRPLLCFSADTNPIRALSWAPYESNSESANVIATAGHGGLKFWDLRDPFRPLWEIDHIPRFIYSLDWLPRCVLLSFDDGTMRILSLMKAASDVPVTGKPFVGTKQMGLHNLSCMPFAIWSVQVSRLTGMVAYCCADGTVFRFQLTSKAVEKEPKPHNRAPHFLCVSLTEEESAVTINIPESNTPFPLKVTRNKAETNKVKTENDKQAQDTTSEDQVLALCDGGDPGIELECGEKVVSLKSKQTRKSGSGKKKPEDDRALVCIDEGPINIQEEEIGEAVGFLKSKKTRQSRSSKKRAENDQSLGCIDEEPTITQEEEIGNEPEVFPSKMVAMHRVRWNMNKGSERWLCYGGAAGIVRCQEIVLSDIDKKWAAKR